jgi:23S rRNA (uracil1939-C5)-methyltransferase
MADAFTVKVEKIAAGGVGLARVELNSRHADLQSAALPAEMGKTDFLEGSAPDETVLCRIIEEHRSWARGELLEIVEPSPQRVSPPCELYGKCGGCNLQHLNYSAQLAAKTAILEEAFTRIGGFPQSCLPQIKVYPSEPWRYRNRMQFHSTADGAWGLKARKTNEIIPVDYCLIADPGIRALLRNRAATSLLTPPAKRFTVYSRNGLFLSENGIRQGKTKILNRELALDIGVFFQGNGAMLEKLIADLWEIASTADRSLPMADLYCGVGTFAAFLGKSFSQVDLVEEDKTALSLARENLIPLFVDFYAQRSEEWAKNLPARRYSFIVADPPRQGFHPALTQRLAAHGPPLLAYVSCDPATQARDSANLCKGGYELIDLRCYDFYPQTAHIESLAVFSRLK